MGTELAILILRLVVGSAVMAHGARKLFGWFGGEGLPGTGRFLESLGFRPGIPFALVGGLAEFISGLLLVLGLLGPLGPAMVLAVMLVALFTVHRGNGFFGANGAELAVLYITAALALAFAGPGLFSVDSALGLDLLIPEDSLWVALAGAGVATVLTMRLRSRVRPRLILVGAESQVNRIAGHRPGSRSTRAMPG